MTLRTYAREPAPRNCGECEFSHDFEDCDEDGGICCVRDKTGHAKKQVLCDWYIRLGKPDLRVELSFVVPAWLKAIAIIKLKAPVSAEAVVNIMEGMTGQELARAEEEKDEK